MSLTPDQEEYKWQIAEAKSRHETLICDCCHFVELRTEPYRFAYCAICGNCFRWYCPDSPDHTCHYKSHGGRVVRIDGIVETVPVGHDATNECGEWCIFCGEPYERK